MARRPNSRWLVGLLMTLLIAFPALMISADCSPEIAEIQCGSKCEEVGTLNQCKTGGDPTEACSEFPEYNSCMSSPNSPCCQ